MEHKADLIRLVSQDADQSAAMPADMPLAWVLDMRLSDFQHSGRPVAVQTPWYPERLWFVPADADAAVLMSEGVTRGRIWTARELMDLLSVPGITKDQAKTVALAKLKFGGDVVSLRPSADGQGCPIHGPDRLWRSVHGPTICARCHPPATPGLVAEWIGEEPETEDRAGR
jgi:hypothetical protein